MSHHQSHPFAHFRRTLGLRVTVAYSLASRSLRSGGIISDSFLTAGLTSISFPPIFGAGRSTLRLKQVISFSFDWNRRLPAVGTRGATSAVCGIVGKEGDAERCAGTSGASRSSFVAHGAWSVSIAQTAHAGPSLRSRLYGSVATACGRRLTSNMHVRDRDERGET